MFGKGEGIVEPVEAEFESHEAAFWTGPYGVRVQKNSRCPLLDSLLRHLSVSTIYATFRDLA